LVGLPADQQSIAKPASNAVIPNPIVPQTRWYPYFICPPLPVTLAEFIILLSTMYMHTYLHIVICGTDQIFKETTGCRISHAKYKRSWNKDPTNML
jgi:hypothetical protein